MVIGHEDMLNISLAWHASLVITLNQRVRNCSINQPTNLCTWAVTAKGFMILEKQTTAKGLVIFIRVDSSQSEYSVLSIYRSIRSNVVVLWAILRCLESSIVQYKCYIASFNLLQWIYYTYNSCTFIHVLTIIAAEGRQDVCPKHVLGTCSGTGQC